ALDKETGKTVWKKDRDIDYQTTNGDLKKAFATPAIIDVNGQPQLICPSAVATQAFSPFTGEEIWKVYHGGMNAAARPVFGHGLVFVCTGDGGFMKLFAVRPDGHGDVTRSHVAWHYGKAVPTRCSFLLIGDLLYLINEAGIASCLEATAGRGVWQERLKGDF